MVSRFLQGLALFSFPLPLSEGFFPCCIRMPADQFPAPHPWPQSKAPHTEMTEFSTSLHIE